VYHVYILASWTRVLQVGGTSNLENRIAQHRSGSLGGFTCRYRVTRLVHVEPLGDVGDAIAREKQIKGWLRSKKISLVSAHNPQLRDLAAAQSGNP